MYKMIHFIGFLLNTHPVVKQPPYEKWRRIKIGMSEKEVQNILGTPIRKDDHTSEGDTLYTWRYGYLHFKNIATNMIYPFDIYFSSKTRKTSLIVDPYKGEYSSDGVPTMPRIIKPECTKIIDYYPRYIDFRWQSSSGNYPITYELEIQQLESGDKGVIGSIEIVVIKTDNVYAAYNHGGKGVCRWRIRACNASGKSIWSEYRKFEFKR